jgi:DNA-binding transcriptional LysR family regulator
VFVESHQIYCSHPHPLYGSTFDNPALLKDQSFFLLANTEPGELSAFRRRFGLGVRAHAEVQSIAELKRLILTGAAIGFLPNVSVAERIQVPDLWPLLVSTALPRCSMQMVTRRQAAISLPTQVFLDDVRRQFCSDKLDSAMSCSG